MPSAFSWPVLVPSALRAPAPVNLGVRLSENTALDAAYTLESTSAIEMKRIIEERLEIEVYVGAKGHVCLKQVKHHEDDVVITVHPDDVTKLIDFLKEVQAEAYVARASDSSCTDEDE
ncbi:hypothetical protein GTZ97_14510 [Aquabacterium fontiphilum]|uniref:hypothetical protein n=1 Tax=Aquabacterium fontiphilum TaxID=450365 RepID=UPI0013779B2A|nr:hypothetical protein [Aquabacterium fontiphilum]NBD21870.1 hypothetical protein [Aquabacterium fontiphilum]